MTRLRTSIAEPAAKAPDAWTPPAGSLPKVLVHLSPLAPGLEGAALSDDTRWRWMAWVTPGQVVRRVLLRLQRRADQVCLRAIDGTEGVEVHDGAPPLDGCDRLLAIIFDVPAAAIRLAWSAVMPSAEIERQAIGGATVLILKPREAA
jgi:hypothetical protein